MNIAVFHDLPSGGGKRALHALCRELFRRGHHLDLLMPDTANEAFLPLDPFIRSKRVFPMPGARRTSPDRPAEWTPWAWGMADRCHRRIAEEIDRGGYDLAFVQQARYPNIPAVLKYLATPSVLYLQEPNRILYEAPVADASGAPEAPFRARLRRHPLIRSFAFSLIHRKRADQRHIRHARTVLANSYYSRESILRAYGISATVVYLGVDLDLFRPLRLPREPLVLAVGAAHPSKGHRFLIESIGRIPPARRPRLMIVADREKAGERDLLMRMAADRGLALAIQSVSDDELVQWYNRAAAVAVVPYLEPFGFTPLEAMACGTPVVGIREGGVRESVIDGETGLLVDRDPDACTAALERLLADESLRERMGQAGRQAVETRWTWAGSADRLEQVFERIKAEG